MTAPAPRDSTSLKVEPPSPLGNDEVTWLSDDTFYQTAFVDVIDNNNNNYNDDGDPYNIKFEDDLEPSESKAAIASTMLESLENLMDLDDLIKGEPLFLDEKMLPTILDDVEGPRAISVIKMESTTAKKEATSPDDLDNTATNTSLLLNEFENVYGVVGFDPSSTATVNHETLLTPPQSPPGGDRGRRPVLTTLKPLTAQSLIDQQPQYASIISMHPFDSYVIEAASTPGLEQKEPQLLVVTAAPGVMGAYDGAPQKLVVVPPPMMSSSPQVVGGGDNGGGPLAGSSAAAAAATIDYPMINTPQPDIAHELAVVDELVRSRVENMQWEQGGPCPPSPCSNSSSNSNFGDCSSDSGCDPEWVPETVEQLQHQPNHNNRRSSCTSADHGTLSSTDEDTSSSMMMTTSSSKKEQSQQQQQQVVRRKKSYMRTSPIERKSRKKEQNKNAATRYRMKKKAEVEVILSEEKQLADYNQDLENKITDMQREIKYLKGLMYDLFKAKGLIN